MAQSRTRSGTGTKANGTTRAKARSAGTKPASRSATSARSKVASKRAAQRSGTAGRAPAARRPAAKPSSSQRSSNGHSGVAGAKDVVANAANDAGNGVLRVTRKAKTPLLTGGAALAGAAGVVATRRAAKLADTKKAARVGFQIRSQDLARTAKEIGSFGEQLGLVAAELRRTREAAAASRDRSPIEVVLQGLTARRHGAPRA